MPLAGAARRGEGWESVQGEGHAEGNVLVRAAGQMASKPE